MCCTSSLAVCSWATGYPAAQTFGELPGWYWPRISAPGKVLLGFLFLLGLWLCLLLSHRKPTLWATLRKPAPLLFLFAGVLGHLLTLWILAVDPSRNASGVPLERPFDELAHNINFLLHLLGPVFVGFAAAQLVLALRARRLNGWAIFSLLVGLYIAWLTPWMGVIVWD